MNTVISKLYWFFLGTPTRHCATLLLGTIILIVITAEMEFPGILIEMAKSFPNVIFPLLVLGMTFFGLVVLLLDGWRTWNKKRGRRSNAKDA